MSGSWVQLQAVRDRHPSNESHSRWPNRGQGEVGSFARAIILLILAALLVVWIAELSLSVCSLRYPQRRAWRDSRTGLSPFHTTMRTRRCSRGNPSEPPGAPRSLDQPSGQGAAAGSLGVASSALSFGVGVGRVKSESDGRCQSYTASMPVQDWSAISEPHAEMTRHSRPVRSPPPATATATCPSISLKCFSAPRPATLRHTMIPAWSKRGMSTRYLDYARKHT